LIYLQELKEQYEQALKETAEQDAPKQQRVGVSGGEEPGKSIPIPMDTMSEEMLKEMKKVYKKQPQKKQDEYENAADQMFRSIDDSIVEQLGGKLSPDAPKTHAQMQAERELAAELEEYESPGDDEIDGGDIDDIDDDIDTLLQEQKQQRSEYERYYQEVREYEDALYKELYEIFYPSQSSQVRLRESGYNINLQAVFQRTAARKAGASAVDNRIFEQRKKPETRDYAISILVDQSWSMMSNAKYIETFKAVILLSEVLNRLGINFEVNGFDDYFRPVKGFDDDHDDTMRESFSTLLAPGGNTNTQASLMRVSRDLEQQDNQEKFIICLTDGQAQASRAVEHIMTQTDQKLIGIGIGQGTGSVTNDFPVSLPNVGVSQLQEALAELLKSIIANPKQFRA
jgi:uncharacterized protein with von Willebrand factor type A (vWA) domain